MGRAFQQNLPQARASALIATTSRCFQQAAAGKRPRLKRTGLSGARGLELPRAPQPPGCPLGEAGGCHPRPPTPLWVRLTTRLMVWPGRSLVASVANPTPPRRSRARRRLGASFPRPSPCARQAPGRRGTSPAQTEEGGGLRAAWVGLGSSKKLTSRACFPWRRRHVLPCACGAPWLGSTCTGGKETGMGATARALLFSVCCSVRSARLLKLICNTVSLAPSYEQDGTTMRQWDEISMQ